MPKKKTSLVSQKPATPSRYENHAYINPDGTVDGEKLLSIVSRSPGAFELIMLNAMIEKGNIAPDYYVAASEIVSGLVWVIMLAGHGDEQSQIQIKAIKKLVHPAKYDLPASKVKDIVDRYETSPPLARAWELRRLMFHLSHLVQPLKNNRPHLERHPIRLRDVPPDTHLLDLAKRHWKPNTTLQSLAIRIYLEQLEEQGVTGKSATISDRSLKRDLELARNWELTASEDEKLRRGQSKMFWLTNESFTWYQYSEGWKARRLAAQSKKNTTIEGRKGGGKDRKNPS